MHMLVRLSVVRMLVVCTESAPLIHLSLKFFHPITQSLYLVHTQHFSFVTSFTPPSIPVSQSSHVTVWHSLSYCLTHFRCVSCFIFLHLAGCSLADAARLLFMIGYHNGHLHLLAVEPRANRAPRFRVALRCDYAFARMRIRCSDSLAEHIDFSSDKCHKCSENVRCPTIISSTVFVRQLPLGLDAHCFSWPEQLRQA